MTVAKKAPATSSSLPRVGLITDDDLNRHTLQSLLSDAGFDVICSLDPNKLEDYCTAFSRLETAEKAEQAYQLDGWLVHVDDECSPKVIDLLIEHSDDPMLVSDEMPALTEHEAFQGWCRKLLEKLEVVAVKKNGDHSDKATNTEQYAKDVWVLAASLGGPDAVKRFLNALAPGLPIAMVYAQHIESSFDSVLTDTVGREQAYPMQLAKGEQKLVPGEILVVPVDHQVRFLEFGRVVELRKSWQGSYQPEIDQVIAELARLYRKNFGVIVFSGMCNDGEIGCRVVKSCGGKVWAQTPASCASDDMPKAAIGTDCVSLQGTPEELAKALSEHYQTEAVDDCEFVQREA